MSTNDNFAHPNAQYEEYLRIVRDYCSNHPTRKERDLSIKMPFVLLALGVAGSFSPFFWGLWGSFAAAFAFLIGGFLFVDRINRRAHSPLLFANYTNRLNSIALEDPLLGMIADSHVLLPSFKRYVLERLDERGTVSTNDVEAFFDGYRSHYQKAYHLDGKGAAQLRLAVHPSTPAAVDTPCDPVEPGSVA